MLPVDDVIYFIMHARKMPDLHPGIEFTYRQAIAGKVNNDRNELHQHISAASEKTA